SRPSARSPQSATHPSALPTMSKTPQLDLQLVREPVFTGAPAAKVLQSGGPVSAPGSGVPAAARCHSSFLISRFPEKAHAWSAWNQLKQVLGNTPGIEA